MKLKGFMALERKKGDEHMKMFVAVMAVFIAIVFTGSAMAVPPGKTVEYAGGGTGKVVFDGKVHADKGLKCNDCHTKIFQMKKVAKITMADMNAGKFCGDCHNGTERKTGDKNVTIFASKDAASCGKCHKK